MNITAVETFVLSGRRAYVKVSTDEGVDGWGECVLEHQPTAVTAAIDTMREHLIGADPRFIGRIWQVLARGGFYRGGPVLGSAVAGIDQALWDLKGKALGVPVHELLGGAVRDRVKIYRHAGYAHRAGNPEGAAAAVAEGVTMFKFTPPGPIGFIESPQWIDTFLTEVAEFREAIGPNSTFGIDFHGRFSVPLSRKLLPLLEEFDVGFVEEPLRPEHSHLVGELVAASTIPIATGERLYTRYEFQPVLEAGIAIAQPDPSHAYGISEVFRIAAQSEIYDVQLAPHCPLGPIAYAACVAIDFAVPNFLAQETVWSFDDEAGPDFGIIRNAGDFAAVDGHIPLTTKPGLGIDVDEELVRERSVTEFTDGSPQFRYPDGSFAEW